MSWDFDFGEEETFTNFFEEADASFVADASGESFFQAQHPVIVEQQIISSTPVVDAFPAQSLQDQASQSLIDENNRLREFFNSLKEKADQVQQQNTVLKTQLNECRSWFKQAMFSGIHSGKK